MTAPWRRALVVTAAENDLRNRSKRRASIDLTR